MNDLKFALRQLLKHPGFTAVAVLTLALGIGVNTSMFTAVQFVLLRELAYPDADRLVRVFRTSPHSQRWPHSPANFLDYRDRNEVFDHLAAVATRPFNLAEAGVPAERVRGLLASADLFPLLGVPPALGRAFTSEEDQPGRNQVAVLDHGFWLRRFAGDSNIIGRTLRLDGESVTVIGVMPAQFRDPFSFGPVDVWRPMAFTAEEGRNRGGNYLQLFARLKPGTSLAQAQAGMDTLISALRKDYPDLSPEEGLSLVPMDRAIAPKGQMVLWFTLALSGFVLLIACVNLANLQFARTATRTREIAIRGALGAPRGRVIRQLLTESLLLAAIGGAVGVLLADWGNRLLNRQIVVDGEAVLALSLNLKGLSFALAAATVSGLAFGLVPAWLASRADVNEVLKQGSRGVTDDRSQHRLQQTLVVAEVALAMVLLAGAGLVVNGLREFAAINPGWRVGGLTVGYLSLPQSKYGDGHALRSFVDRLQEKLAAVPGVERAAVSWSLPVSSFNVAGTFGIEGREAPPRGREPLRYLNGVTPGYFETLGTPLLAGREFDAADLTNRPAVVIINETMARVFWPGESPIGKRIGTEEIVGVAGDVRFPADPSEPQTRFQTYRPLAQEPRHYLSVAIRGSVSAESLRRAVAELDADLPVNQAGTAEAAVGRALDNIAVGGRLFSAFAGLGLSLAALGIYGVIAGFVARRTHEIGVRIALGAQMGQVLRLVIGKGLRLALLGTAFGLAGAYGISRLLVSVAPDLKSNPPLTLLCVAAVLVAVALFACWLPARRAARVDPMEALRNEG